MHLHPDDFDVAWNVFSVSVRRSRTPPITGRHVLGSRHPEAGDGRQNCSCSATRQTPKGVSIYECKNDGASSFLSLSLHVGEFARLGNCQTAPSPLACGRSRKSLEQTYQTTPHLGNFARKTRGHVSLDKKRRAIARKLLSYNQNEEKSSTSFTCPVNFYGKRGFANPSPTFDANPVFHG